MKRIANWPVMKAQCATCPFRPDGDPRIRASVESRVFKCSQICHHPAIHGRKETHLCRGSRDFQLVMLYRMGMLDAPTDEAFAAESKKIGGRRECR